MSRIQNFEKKINYLQTERAGMLEMKDKKTAAIIYLHQETSIQLEHLDEIENDLDKTSKLIDTYRKMIQLWHEANLILIKATEERIRIEAHYIVIKQAKEVGLNSLNTVHNDLHLLLQEKNELEPKIFTFQETLNKQEMILQNQMIAHQITSTNTYTLMCFCPGHPVMTRYGYGVVRVYRESDNMVLVTLSFGYPSAKLWINGQELAQYERMLQSKEREGMAMAEEENKGFYKKEKIKIKKELYKMKREDADMKEYSRVMDRLQREAEELQKAVTDSIIASSLAFDNMSTLETAKMIKTYLNQQQSKAVTSGGAVVKDGTSVNSLTSSLVVNASINSNCIYGNNNNKFANSVTDKNVNKANSNTNRRPSDAGSVHQSPQRVVVSMEKSFRSSKSVAGGAKGATVTASNRSIHSADTHSSSPVSTATTNTPTTTGAVGTTGTPVQFKSLSAWQVFKKRKEIVTDIRNNYIQKAMDETEEKVLATQAKRPMNERINYFSDLLLNEVVYHMLYQLIAETIQEGIDAKAIIQEIAGIYFPRPKWMQESTYKNLLISWEDRKKNITAKVLVYEAEHENEEENELKRKNRRLTMDVYELERQRLLDLEMKKEQERMYVANQEMFLEEMLCREFYSHELVHSLKERREMKEEDDLALLLRFEYNELQQQRLKALKNKNNGGHYYFDNIGGDNSGGEYDDGNNNNNANKFERRRKDLKDMVIDRRHRQLEQAYMIIEDRRAFYMREETIAALQKASLLFENIHNNRKNGSIDNDSYRNSNYDNYSLTSKNSKGSGQSNRGQYEIPQWLFIPSEWDDWNVTKQLKYIDFHNNIRRKQDMIDDKALYEKQQLMEIQKKSYDVWFGFYREIEIFSLRSEIVLMETQEDRNQAEFRLMEFQDHLNAITTDCRNKGNLELKLKNEYKILCNTFHKIELELLDGLQWESTCKNRMKKRDETKLKIEAECRYIDTKSALGFHQRFHTDIFRKAIYSQFFHEIVIWLITHAELIANERQLLDIHESLTYNQLMLKDREFGISNVRKTLRRKDCLRMRRSILNQSFFPKYRRHILTSFFQSWVRFMQWNKNEKDAYLLNYQVIRNKIELDQIFKKKQTQQQQQQQQQDSDNSNRMNVRMNNNTIIERGDGLLSSSSSSSSSIDDHSRTDNNSAVSNSLVAISSRKNRVKSAIRDFNNNTAAGKSKSLPNNVPMTSTSSSSSAANPVSIATNPATTTVGMKPISTLMSGYRDRPIVCLTCTKAYNEAQNHASACYYHPKPYRFYCPTTCINPGKTSLCNTHRCKRWTCCDIIEKSNTGCCTGYHKPLHSDQVYDQLVNSLIQTNAMELEALSKQVEVTRRMNWPDQLHTTRRHQLDSIEDKLNLEKTSLAMFQEKFKRSEVLGAHLK